MNLRYWRILIPFGSEGRWNYLFCFFALGLVVSCANVESPKVPETEIVNSAWSFRVSRPPQPWRAGVGRSVFSKMGLTGDYFFHNPFTGGVISIRVFPLSFRYRKFQLADHARRVYGGFLNGWGNDMRALRGDRFLPIEQSWKIQKRDGIEWIEFEVQGGISQPIIDEKAEKVRIEEELLSGDTLPEEKFGPETREMRQKRIAREKEQGQITRGARGKFVLILKRGRITDVLYEFVFVDHDLSFDNTRHAFDQMVTSFQFSN